MDASNYKTQRETQAKMGRQCKTGYSSIELQKLDSLCPRSCKIEKGIEKAKTFKRES
jgi:hypothetical protein